MVFLGFGPLLCYGSQILFNPLKHCSNSVQIPMLMFEFDCNSKDYVRSNTDWLVYSLQKYAVIVMYLQRLGNFKNAIELNILSLTVVWLFDLSHTQFISHTLSLTLYLSLYIFLSLPHRIPLVTVYPSLCPSLIQNTELWWSKSVL